MTDQLGDLLAKAASMAISDGITRDMIDGHPGGNVHKWAKINCRMNPSQEFFVVTLLAAEISDEYARREGYESQVDRAAKLMRSA